MRTLLDKRKLREPGYCYEAVANATFTSQSTISRVMNGKQFPSIEQFFDIVKAITGKLPTNKLIEQWKRAARERKPKKPKDYFTAKVGTQFEAEARKKERQDQGILARQRCVLGSVWGPRRAWALITGAASTVLLIVAYVFTDRTWLAATATIPGVVVAVGVLAGSLPAHLVGTAVAAVLRLVVHGDSERTESRRKDRHRD